MTSLYFIIGASGAGKTTAVKDVEQSNPDDFQFYYFDTIGVPSREEMERDYGSMDEWQRINTTKWVTKAKEEFVDGKPTILDGQTKPSFIKEACSQNDVTSYKVILFDCTDTVRKKRLIDRNQPDLANAEMMNWAKYLREQSLDSGYVIIDNSTLTQKESAEALLKALKE